MEHDAVDQKPEVIVIGGGIAGLATAAELAARDVRVLLIETRTRLGGRIVTEFSGGAAVELGAEFLHGREPALGEYLRRHWVATADVDGSDYYFDGERLRRTDSGGDEVDNEGNTEAGTDAMGLLSQLSEEMPDQSFAEYAGSLSLNSEQRGWLTGYVEGFNAAEADIIGIRGLARQQHAEDAIDGDHSARLVNGYAAPVDALARDCATNVRTVMGTRIEGVRWRQNEVQVEGWSTNRDLSQTPFSAHGRAVVVTVPLPILFNMRFTPSIPILGELPTALRMGAAVRLTLRMREAWWETRALGMGFLFGGPIQSTIRGPAFRTFWVNRNAPVALITAWAAGPAARELEGLSKPELVKLAVENLALLFELREETLAAQVTEAHFHDWRSDPLTGDAYSYVRAGGLETAERFTQPVAGTVWFAGEATASEGHWGTVHGAYLSGIRAARQIAGKLAG